MADFRKLVLALLAVTLLLSTTASAQFPPVNCVANTGVPPLLRSEGHTELVGDVVIQCTGGDPNALPATVNFDIFMTLPVTSDIEANGLTEALIIIDEAGAPGRPPQALGTSVFQGLWSVARGTQRLTWDGVPFQAPGTADVRFYRITNVRVDAHSAGVPNNAVFPTEVQMLITISPPNSLPISNPQQIVGRILPSLRTAVEENTFRQCELPSPAEVSLTFTERFASAFKKQNEGIQSVPGTVYATESGLNPTFNTNIGAANTGTRFLIRFQDVPAGVTLGVPGQVGLSAVDLYLQRITGWGVYYSGGSPAAGGNVPLSGGAGEVLYEVRGDPLVNDISENNSFEVVVTVAYEAGVELGAAQVWMSYAPLVAEPAAGLASATLPEPRFFLDPAPEFEDLFTINPCRTLLLFPYLTSVAGFDSGFSIANTSEDPFGTVGQDGKCTMYFYQHDGDTTVWRTIENVESGNTLVSVLTLGCLGSGFCEEVPGGAPAQGLDNFVGYMIAICDFQYAHGFAFISDAGATQLAQGYLALIIPDKASCSQTYVDEDGVVSCVTGPTKGLRAPEAFSRGAGENDGEQLAP